MWVLAVSGRLQTFTHHGAFATLQAQGLCSAAVFTSKLQALVYK